MTEFKIPIRDKDGNVKWAIVSKENHEELNKFKWADNGAGYACMVLNRKSWLMHRYIKGVLMKEEITNKIIDHKNNIRLDNRNENLRFITYSENARNRKKKGGTSSKYYGVSISGNKWRVSIKFEEERWALSYKEEIHAAWQYNLWIDQLGFSEEVKNNIEEPTDFVQAKSILDGRELPLCIYKCGEKFKVRINKKIVGTYDTLKEAIKVKEEELEKRENLKLEEKKKNNPLKEMEITFDNKKETVNYFTVERKGEEFNIIIDKDKYEDIIKYSWHITANGYAITDKINVNGEEKKNILMHRYIKECYDSNDVDHVNNNRLDNRKDNLRMGSKQQNSQNKSKNKNSNNEYKGVVYVKEDNVYKAHMVFESKVILNKRFEEEIDAVIFRDKFILANKEILSHTKIELREKNYKIQNNHILYKDEEENENNDLKNFKFKEDTPKSKSSVYDGVRYSKRDKNYETQIGKKGDKFYFSKRFETELEAALQRDVFILINKTLFSIDEHDMNAYKKKLNFLEEDYKIKSKSFIFKDGTDDMKKFKIAEINLQEKSSDYKGVSYYTYQKKFFSGIESKKYKIYFDKGFDTELEAVYQRDLYIIFNKDKFLKKDEYKKKLNFLEEDYKIKGKFFTYKNGEKIKINIDMPVRQPKKNKYKGVYHYVKTNKFGSKIIYKNDDIDFRETFDTELEAIQQRDIYILNNKDKFPKKDEYKKKLNLSEDNYILNPNNEYTIKQ